MKYTYILILLFISVLARAQEEHTNACVQNIELAQQQYDEGRIQDIQSLLEDCLAAGTYTKAEESQALRLLTLAYIFLDDEVNAEYNMLLLLKANHEFEVNAAIDPTEFINLHDRFRTKPLFNIGVRYIVNFAQPIVADLNNSLNLNDERPDYSLIFGNFGIGLNFEYEFADKFFIYPEVHYKSMSIASTFEQVGVINSVKYIMIENFEDQNWLSLPVSVKYVFEFENLPKIKAYANLGASVDFLLSSSLPSDGTILSTTGDPVVGFTIDSTLDHNRVNFGILGGGGVTYKLGEGFLSFEARYQYGLTKLTQDEFVLNPGDARKINTLVQDDIYRLNHIALSLGYTKYMYFPKKMK